MLNTCFSFLNLQIYSRFVFLYYHLNLNGDSVTATIFVVLGWNNDYNFHNDERTGPPRSQNSYNLRQGLLWMRTGTTLQIFKIIMYYDVKRRICFSTMDELSSARL